MDEFDDTNHPPVCFEVTIPLYSIQVLQFCFGHYNNEYATHKKQFNPHT